MISVCMATYNGQKYLKEQIDSILNQLHNKDELIISDDCSTDDTWNIINSYNDKRIKPIRNNNYHGVIGNFENAINNSIGDYIFLSDQDDVWLPNKVETFMEVFKRTSAAVLLSDCKMSDANLNVISESKFKEENVGIGVLKNIVKCGYLGSCMAFTRECLTDFLPIPNNKYIFHDIWIGLTSGSKRKFVLINQPTMIYRRHDAAVTATGFVEIGVKYPKGNSFWFKIKKRFVLVLLFIKWKVRNM